MCDYMFNTTHTNPHLLAALTKPPPLKPAPFTRVTRHDGSRFIERGAGDALVPIAPEASDEDGQWAVMDYNAATGVAAPGGAPPASSAPSPPADAARDDEALETMISENWALEKCSLLAYR